MDVFFKVASGAAVLMGVGSLLAGEGPVIDLGKPVSASLPEISGIYWNFDTEMGPGALVEDLSGNGYHGTPMAGNGAAPARVPGVDRPGTSGFGQAIRLKPGEAASGEGNPRAMVNLEARNRLGMAGQDFTGGAWVRFFSVGEENQVAILFDKGGFNTKAGEGGGHFCLYLAKNREGAWSVGFQVGDGWENTNASSGPPQPWNFQDGQWHHVGFGFHATPGSENTVSFWVDGQAAGTAPVRLNLTAGAEGSASRRFSVGERVTTHYLSTLDGAVDDVFLTEGLYEFKPPQAP